MKALVFVSLAFILSLASSLPRKHGHDHVGKKPHRHESRLREGSSHSKAKSDSRTKKYDRSELRKSHGKIFKKFGMFAAPVVPLEDTSASPGQAVVRQPSQQVLVPISSVGFSQSNAAPEMVESYSNTPAQPTTLGTEVAGDQTNGATQTEATQEAQPTTVQYQREEEGSQPMVAKAAPQNTGAPQVGLPGEAPQTQLAGGAEQTELTGSTTQSELVGGAPQTELTGGAAEAIDPSAGADATGSFAQPADAEKEEEVKNLQVYNGALPETEQSKPQIEGVGPQEEVKVVNLGDDEKTANQPQDRPCGGCPLGATCINGQCQIREQDAKAQGLTGKGTASNPGSVSDLRNMESQELQSLLKDATNADITPGASPETPTGSPETAEFQNQGQDQIEPQRQELEETTQQADQLITPQPQHEVKPLLQPRFSSAQVKELRDFARMYKMYQFIRKMEERINDPDCAPICRKLCKPFCPEKCCRGHRNNGTLQLNVAQTVANVNATGLNLPSVTKPHRLDAALMEDEDDKEEKQMNENAGKKHVFVKIVKNNILDQPRRFIQGTD